MISLFNSKKKEIHPLRSNENEEAQIPQQKPWMWEWDQLKTANYAHMDRLCDLKMITEEGELKPLEYYLDLFFRDRYYKDHQCRKKKNIKKRLAISWKRFAMEYSASPKNWILEFNKRVEFMIKTRKSAAIIRIHQLSLIEKKACVLGQECIMCVAETPKVKRNDIGNIMNNSSELSQLLILLPIIPEPYTAFMAKDNQEEEDDESDEDEDESDEEDINVNKNPKRARLSQANENKSTLALIELMVKRLEKFDDAIDLVETTRTAALAKEIKRLEKGNADMQEAINKLNFSTSDMRNDIKILTREVVEKGMSYEDQRHKHMRLIQEQAQRIQNLEVEVQQLKNSNRHQGTSSSRNLVPILSSNRHQGTSSSRSLVPTSSSHRHQGTSSSRSLAPTSSSSRRQCSPSNCRNSDHHQLPTMISTPTPASNSFLCRPTPTRRYEQVRSSQNEDLEEMKQ